MVYNDFLVDDASEDIKNYVLKSEKLYREEEEERIKEERKDDSTWVLSDERDFPGYFVMSGGVKLVLKENSMDDLLLFGYAVTFHTDGTYYIYILAIDPLNTIILDLLEKEEICYNGDVELLPALDTILIKTEENSDKTFDYFKEFLVEKFEGYIKTSSEYKNFLRNLKFWTKP